MGKNILRAVIYYASTKVLGSLLEVHIRESVVFCVTHLLFQRHVFEVYEYRITVCHGGSQESCRWKQGELRFRIDSLIKTNVASHVELFLRLKTSDSTWRIPYWWCKMAEIHWGFLIGCYLRGKSSTPNNNKSERPSGFLYSDVVIMEFLLAFAHVFPRFASASCNSRFDWLQDYLCLLSLASVFPLLVLRHSVENRSIAWVFFFFCTKNVSLF